MRIQGNERADELATSSKHLVPTTSQIQFQDIKPLVNSSVFQLWQLAWSLECENKLYVIKPALGMWESASHRTRRHEVLLCRPRIGSSYLTHKHLLGGKPHHSVTSVAEHLTILLILWLCSGLEQEQQIYFPEFFSHQIPFYPALLIGENPFDCVINYLRKISVLLVV